MSYIRCKVCDTGILERRKKYRLSGPAVFIGYILLIPSIFGIAFSMFMLFGSAAASSGTQERTRNEVKATLSTENVPSAVIYSVLNGDDDAVDKWVNQAPNPYHYVTGEEIAAIRQGQSELRSRTEGRGIAAGILGGFSMLIGIAFLVSGLFGWLLVMKKWVLQCRTCKATLNAS